MSFGITLSLIQPYFSGMAEDFSLEGLEERFERDLERFKKNVFRAFSGRSD